MRKYVLILFFVVFFSMPVFAHEGEQHNVQCVKENEAARVDPYKDITWDQVNNERESKQSGFFTKIYSYFVKEKEEATYSGDTVRTVAVTTVDDDSDTEINIIPVITQ